MGLWRRLRATLGAAPAEQAFDEEARFHLERRVEDYLREGMSAEEARAAAARRFGNVTLARERTRDADTLRWLTDLGADLRYAARVLRRNPGFSAVAMLTLALGIGANTAIFAAAYGTLLRPLPYPHADRLVRLSEYHVNARSPLPDAYISDMTYDAWRAGGRTLDVIAAYGLRAFVVGGTGSGDAERVQGVAASPALFTALGVAPAAGRFFVPDEAIEGGPSVVVLSHGYWQRRFGGRTDAVGQSLLLDGDAHTIVGVAPAGFAFPDPDRQLYTPYVLPRVAPAAPAPSPREAARGPLPAEVTSNPNARRSLQIFFAIGRLAPGATPEQAEAEGTSLARAAGPRPIAAEMLFGKGGPVTVRAAHIVGHMTARVRPIMLLLTAGVALVLLLGCANVASLLLSRGAARERELAVRAAIGAGRGRLVRQLLAESLVLSVSAAMAGLLLAWGFVRIWPTLAPRGFPRIEQVQLDGWALLFAAGASLLAGALVGIAPALHGSRVQLLTGLRDAISAAGAGRATRTRRLLLVLQGAFAVMLLVGATLLVRSFDRLITRDVGYEAAHVFNARVFLPDGEDLTARWKRVASAVDERLRGGTGVKAAGVASMAPLGDATLLIGFALRGDRPEPIVARAMGYVVSPGYLEALRLRLRQGRAFTAADATAPIQALIVNDAFVRAYLNDGKPVVGRRYTDVLKDDSITEIVGVIGDVLKNGVRDEPHPEIYVPLGNQGTVNTGRQINLVMRTEGDVKALAETVRALVREVEPQAAVQSVVVLAEDLSASAGDSRFAATMLSAFAALAVSLAGIGLYGALLYAITRRTRELGIRRALGATRARLIALVLRESLIVTIAGLAIGLAAAALGARLIRGLLFGVDALDPVSFLVAPLVLVLTALAACALPAWRATSIAPTEALRQD